MHYPDSPEGVAFAMTLIILGYSEAFTPAPFSKEALFQIYRECIAMICEEPILPKGEGFGDRPH